MNYWLMKSEPGECSIDDLANAPSRTVPWVGVRSYQARNYMRYDMRVGDGVLFYHSSCPEPGIAGLAEVASAAYPDTTQFDPASPYQDPKASPASPRCIRSRMKLRAWWFRTPTHGTVFEGALARSSIEHSPGSLFINQ